MKTGGAGFSAVRTVLLLALIAALLLGWDKLGGTVTSVRGSYPLADALFIRGVADAFPGRECMLAADGLPQGLAADLASLTGPMSLAATELRGPRVWLLGSGLRHHYALAALTDENLVVNFDAHADMRSGGDVDCGNWLRHWLDAAPGRRAMVIGVSEMLGGEVWLGRATEFMSLPLLANGRAELWPVRARRSFFREPLPTRVNSPAITDAGGDERGCWLRWRTLADWQLPRGERLAVSVDLDCLADRGFAAEWDTGELPLTRLLALLRGLAEQNTITGISICGFAERQTAAERVALLSTLRGIIAATERKP